MNIGIGVTTFNRPQSLELFISKIKKHTIDYKLHIAIDSSENRMGIAYRKNECLNALKDCDYIFLFDDDCFPISDGWVDYFIDFHKETKQHHFLYLKETTTINKIKSYLFESNSKISLDSYDNSGGCFMFLTKEVIEKVGGFCKEYGVYGFEHAGYSKRIFSAGLNTLGEYLCPYGADKYIYAMDYDNYLDFNEKVGHKTSLEIDKINDYIKYNYDIFKKDLEKIYQPL